MKYVAPYGSGDPNAPYVNGNPSTGVQGSIPPAAAFEHPLREIVAAISGAGLTPDENVLNQLAYAIQKGMNYAVATGTANAWVVGPSLAPLAYAAGLPFDIVAPATNTSTTVNANVSSLGNKRIKKADGTDPAIGDVVSGVLYPTRYDGTSIRIMVPLASDMVAGINASGTAPQLNFFEMVTAGTQSVANTTITRINDFTVSASKASDASFGSGGIVTIGPKTAGVWVCNQYYTPSQTGGPATTTQAYLYKNGVNVQQVTVSGSFCAQTATVRVANGDTLDMRVYQNSGGSRTNSWPSATPPNSTFNLYQISGA